MTAPARVLTASRTLTAVKGKALYHDGIDDYTKVPDDPSLNLTSAITIEVWVKPAQNSTHVTVAAKEHFTNKKGWILIQLGGTDWYFRIYNGTTYKEVSVSNSVDLNTWQHIVATYDKQYMRLYKNGVQIGKRLCDWSIATTSEPLCVGYRSTVGQYFNGTIDEVRIYERALSASEVLYNKEHPYNPILHGCVLWLGHDSIDEGAGMWYDKSGLNNHGTIYGATAVEMNKLAGRVLSV